VADDPTERTASQAARSVRTDCFCSFSICAESSLTSASCAALSGLPGSSLNADVVVSAAEAAAAAGLFDRLSPPVVRLAALAPGAAPGIEAAAGFLEAPAAAAGAPFGLAAAALGGMVQATGEAEHSDDARCVQPRVGLARDDSGSRETDGSRAASAERLDARSERKS